METFTRALDAGIERLQRNRSDHLRMQAVVARTFLLCASTTTSAPTRLRNLRKASQIIDAMKRFSDRFDVDPNAVIDISKALSALYPQLTAIERKGAPTAAAHLQGVFNSLLKGEAVYFFAPQKGSLFAGDLFRMALRLRITCK